MNAQPTPAFGHPSGGGDTHEWGRSARQSRATALLECGSLTPAFQREDGVSRVAPTSTVGKSKRDPRFRAPNHPSASGDERVSLSRNHAAEPRMDALGYPLKSGTPYILGWVPTRFSAQASDSADHVPIRAGPGRHRLLDQAIEQLPPAL